MALGLNVRKFLYQNAASGKIYEVVLTQKSDGTVDGKGLLLGTGKVNSDPDNDNTKITFVVITTQQGVPFGVEDAHAYKTNDHLKLAAIYDAAARGGAGALLSTLLV